MMLATASSTNIPFTYSLGNWLRSKSGDPSAASQITYHLGGRVALLGFSLLSIAEAVGRAVLGIFALLGYVLTFGCWQGAKDQGVEQMQRASLAGSVSLNCLRSLISPKTFAYKLDLTPVIKPKIPSRDLLRSWRIECGTELIADKLQRQFERAQLQAANEADKAFKYLSAPKDFKGQSHTEKVPGYEVGVCHSIGRRQVMEDEHLATSFDVTIFGKKYPVQLFGIFDGHGGPWASIFVRDNLQRELQKNLEEFCRPGISDEKIWNALKITFVKLKAEFGERPSGTTATVAMILDGKLWTANAGDARTILDNGIQLSEDATPSDPNYKRGIERRGGVVIQNRVNATLAVARAIGDYNVGAISARPKITVYPLGNIPKGSHLILTCDGIFDVASTRQVAAAVRTHASQSAEELAKNIVYSAYAAESGDNLSALVVKI